MATKPGDPTKARAALLEVIETQLEANDPPEAREAFERLMELKYPREDCIRLIASALMGELFGALRGKSTYDPARYIENLKALPKLPWEK